MRERKRLKEEKDKRGNSGNDEKEKQITRDNTRIYDFKLYILHEYLA